MNKRDQIPAELQALYDAEKERPAPCDEDRDQVYAAVAASCGIAAAVGTAAVTSAAGEASGGGAGAASGAASASAPAAGAAATSMAGSGLSSLPALLAKPVTLLVFAAGAVAGTGTTLLVEEITSSPAPPARAVLQKRAPTPLARVVAPPAAAEELEPSAPTPAPPPAPENPAPTVNPPRKLPEPLAKRATARKRPQPGSARPPSAASTRSAVVERNLLERARTALSRGKPASALQALRQHQQQYPRGTLAEERQALMVVALASVGQGARARAAARRFKKRHPQSLLLPLVEDAAKRSSKQK